MLHMRNMVNILNDVGSVATRWVLVGWFAGWQWWLWYLVDVGVWLGSPCLVGGVWNVSVCFYCFCRVLFFVLCVVSVFFVLCVVGVSSPDPWMTAGVERLPILLLAIPLWSSPACGVGVLGVVFFGSVGTTIMCWCFAPSFIRFFHPRC